MKNLFKKSAKKETKTTFQALDKKQLEKLVGGVDEITSTASTTDATRIGYKETKVTFGGGTT